MLLQVVQYAEIHTLRRKFRRKRQYEHQAQW